MMPAPTASLPLPRLALAAQGAVLAAVVALAELAPRPGLAALYLPLLPAHRHAALDWALANGAALNGKGPLGGLILTAPPPGLGTRALREGALAIAIPTFLCQPSKAPPHG
ncbi:hypothetical protein [Novosphingobium sp. PASSN1]|uniref:hypothetical protein n=1 Tax=Novosphingobium sp. PASSN1 TaxID=2015561 RepID=UPI000BCA0A9D|nr:hypothetical protein [Novosphingobium sp. PASSN1]OYU35304.1 MAG: hypothetical protein CFE35_09970 [Novosphingobium sp. PASSN1]